MPVTLRVVTAEPNVAFVIDDSVSIREVVAGLLGSLGMRAIGCRTAKEYLAFPTPDRPACLILDVDLPDTNGLEFQQQIANEAHPPIIFMAGNGDIASAVQAIKLGAIDFLTKPLKEADLVRAIHAAIEQDRQARMERAAQADLQRRLHQLTPREREVFPLVISGFLNKQAAAELGISEVTYQIHRRKVMRKMKAASLADLVRVAAKLHVPVVKPG